MSSKNKNNTISKRDAFLSPLLLFVQPVIATILIMLILGAPLENAPTFLLKFSLVFALPTTIINYVILFAMQQKGNTLTRKQLLTINIICQVLQIIFFLAYFIPTFLHVTPTGEPIIYDAILGPDGNITILNP